MWLWSWQVQNLQNGPAIWRPKEDLSYSPSLKAIELKNFSLAWRRSVFSSIQTFYWSDDHVSYVSSALPHTLRKPIYFIPSPLVLTLISSKNTVTETSRMTFEHIAGHSAQSSWYIKLAIIKKEDENERERRGWNVSIKTVSCCWVWARPGSAEDTWNMVNKSELSPFLTLWRCCRNVLLLD